MHLILDFDLKSVGLNAFIEYLIQFPDIITFEARSKNHFANEWSKKDGFVEIMWASLVFNQFKFKSLLINEQERPTLDSSNFQKKLFLYYH